MSYIPPIDDRRPFPASMMPDVLMAEFEAHPELYPDVNPDELHARVVREYEEARRSGKYIFPDDPAYPPSARDLKSEIQNPKSE
jgi:hypothetical protein